MNSQKESSSTREAKLVVRPVGPGLFREDVKNLAIRSRSGDFVCVGYFVDPSRNEISPLTPELKEYCQLKGLEYNGQ